MNQSSLTWVSAMVIRRLIQALKIIQPNHSSFCWEQKGTKDSSILDADTIIEILSSQNITKQKKNKKNNVSLYVPEVNIFDHFWKKNVSQDLRTPKYTLIDYFV